MKRHICRYYTELYSGKHGSVPAASRGRTLGRELGYPREPIESIPDDLWEDFLPCGNVLPYIGRVPGGRILNLGCGAGIDSLAPMLSGRTEYRMVNLDIVYPVLEKASNHTRDLFPAFSPGWLCADGEALPFSAACFDGTILNGVFNLFTDKRALIAELARVLKTEAVVAGADLCRRTALPDYFKTEPDAWAWCMSGALTGQELDVVFEAGGFRKIEAVSERMDEFFDRVVFAFEKSGPDNSNPGLNG